MKKIVNAIDGISGFGGWTAGIMMVLALLIVVAEIFTRSVFTKTLYISDEYAGYLMSMLTFFGLAYTLRERGHIRTTIGDQTFDSRREARRWNDLQLLLRAG